ncbi:hypothetical protein STRIP9103_09578 [Streptomyces ipomoeae 91-03]|uniref:Phosphotyrosine protein phosphatase I domain-containing protein n=1 Tax=Streptomyces ipomoeae 91-03 TaxID=698759 RepID=L1L3K6_9ACTN|nr:hypothetical protein STRIP9103_09578 [Streptomyces ipomoeae 91-03]
MITWSRISMGDGGTVVSTNGGRPSSPSERPTLERASGEGLERRARRSTPAERRVLRDPAARGGPADTCPVFPGKRYLDWQLDDPAGQGVEAVCPIRDTIETRVRVLISEVAPG